MSDRFGRAVAAQAVLRKLSASDAETRASLAIALSEAVDAVLQAIEPAEREYTVEQFRLAAPPARVAEAAEWAELAAHEAHGTSPAGAKSEQTDNHEAAMVLLAAFLTPHALDPADMAAVRELAREGERLGAEADS